MVNHHLYNDDRTIIHTTKAGSFGLILPQETGVYWQHQTGGMMCAQEEFEGIFVPMTRPSVYRHPDDGGPVDLIEELRRWDYPASDNYTELEWESREEIWSKIEEQLRFEFEYLDVPDEVPEGYPKRGSWEWIRILGVEMDDHRGYERPRMAVCNWAEKWAGEKAVLLYENCD